MKNLILFFALLLIAISTFSQKTYIPDPDFRSWLQTNYASCMDGDSLITNCSNVINATSINVSYNSISDLTGIEAFTALDTLGCGGNQLTSLNVFANAALTVLSCSGNQLTSLDVSANTALTYLNCGGNQLTSLNVSANTALTYFNCDGNQLTSLNVKNGNNINFVYFTAFGNPNLFCINVDNAPWSTANWTSIDSWANFNENCFVGISILIDTTYIKIYPNPANASIIIEGLKVGKIEIINLQGQIVKTFNTTNTKSTIDILKLSSGVYTMKIKTDSGIIVKKLIKE